MKNKELIAILETLSPDEEVLIEVRDIASGKVLAETYGL